jgi:hypothetical protein
MTAQQAGWCSMDEYKLRAEGKAEEERHEWERARWQVFMQYAIAPNLKRRPHSPQEVLRFPWEKPEVQEMKNVEPLTEKEIEGLCKLFNLDRNKVVNGQDK